MGTLAVDLGGTWLRGALLGEDGTLRLLQRHRLQSVFDGRPREEVWEQVVEHVAGYAREQGNAAARVALAFPGPIASGKPVVAPTLTGPAAVPADLLPRLRRRTGLPVGIVNDVAAATAFLAAARADRSFFLVTVSSGIGSRVWHRGAAPGVGTYDGEIGHLVVDASPSAAHCDCGGRGHLGALASGRAFERRVREAAMRDRLGYGSSVCGRSGVQSRDLTNELHLVPALLAGDRWTLKLLREAVAPLAKLALQIIVAGGLERCYVIGGFAMALGSIYEHALIAAMEALLDSSAITLDPKAVVHVVEPSTEAVLRGAALAT
ncbi:MAG TPA: ROK family protein [Candidatus Acidoferrum sp.]|nr:ROK family protein [Candidatus Acidoferrum sp.]